MSTRVKSKDPAAELDYVWDWEAWLNGDTIDSYDLEVPDELNLTKQSSTDTSVTGWFSGGVVGEVYNIVCHIVTTDGRQNDWTMRLPIHEQ